MEVYLANPTLQNRIFQFRDVEKLGLREVHIPARRQAKLPGDYEGEGLRAIVEQLLRAGGVQETDIKSGLVAPYGFVFSVSGKPVPGAKIDEAAEKDIKVRQELAGDKTEAAGLALLATAEGGNPGSVRSTTLEVTQMKTDSNREEAEKGGVDVEVRVSRSADKPQRGRKRA